MNKLEFVVEDATLDQHGGGVFGAEPSEESGHEARDVRVWRGHVDDVAEGVLDADVDSYLLATLQAIRE